MTTLHSRQSGDARRTRKNVNTGTFNFTPQIPPSIRAVPFTKRDKTDATIFKSRCSRTVVGYRLDRVQAVPLVWTRFFRLANSSPTIARNPARRSRDEREPSDKKSCDMSRVMSEQFPDNVQADDSQDDVRWLRSIRAAVRTTAVATSRETSRKSARRNLTVMFQPSLFQNYEESNRTTADTQS
jgi:hypothetical protein